MEIRGIWVDALRPGLPHATFNLIVAVLLVPCQNKATATLTPNDDTALMDCVCARRNCQRGGVGPQERFVKSAQALEMSVGKVPFLEAVNGSTVTLPCTYSSCIGIENLYFRWQFNDNGTMQTVCDAVIPSEAVVPKVKMYKERFEFVGMNRKNNISILLWNITFEDGGQYTCFGRNPKEKEKNHSAIFKLIVVDELREVDNTLTIIIASAVGGAIALLMGFMLLKNFTLFVLSKLEEKNKECLVTSSGIDNTENGLSRSKVDSKPKPPKQK